MKHKQESERSDEIDLIELFLLLWKKKITIITITFICVAMATVYSFTAKEQWTSKAEVIAPNVVSLESYLSIRRDYARILGSEFSDDKLSSTLFQYSTNF